MWTMWNKRRLWIAGTVLQLAMASSSAGDLRALVEDPLLVQPPVLSSGVTLPNDIGPVVCPATLDSGNPLTLPSAVDITLCNNPQIKAAWAAIKIQAGSLGEARAAYLPTVSGTVSHLHTTTAFPDLNVPTENTRGHTVYGSVNWELFDFGGRAANHDAAALLLQAAISSHDAAIQKTLTNLIQAYFDAQTAKAALSARQDAIHIAQGTYDSAKRKEHSGAVARSDTLQAASALAKAKLEESRAKGAYDKALSVLVYTMGLPAESSILLPEHSRESVAATPPTLEAWIADAEMHHPAIVAARAQWQAAQRKITAVRSEGLPRLDFSSNYYKNGYPNQGLQSTSTTTRTVGLTLTIPIFDGFSYNYKIYGAKAQAEQKEAELRDTEHQILMDVVKTYADATSALNNLQSSEELLIATKESLNSSTRRYNKGAADITELLNTQSAYNDAEQERVRCLSEWRSARLMLFSTAGYLGSSAFAN